MIKASRILKGTVQQDQAEKFFNYLRKQGIRFRVNEAGTRSVYVQADTPKGLFRVRFADHPAPIYKDPRLEQARKFNYSVDPSTGTSVTDALNYFEKFLTGNI